MKPAYKRVYHYHIRKTAGTSLNAAFWALAGLDLETMSGASRVQRNGLTFVRRTRSLIEKGDYFFANSHSPAHRLQLPRNTYTVTILRDPAARVASFYRYLLWAKANPQASNIEPGIDKLQALAPTVCHGFRSFLERAPPRFLFAQLFMFSEDLDPIEAADNALACSMVCFTETFSGDLKKLAAALELDLTEKHERQFGETVTLTEEEGKLLRELLAPEYTMLERVRADLRPRHSPVLP